MLAHLRSIAFLVSLLPAGAALAQASESSFCEAAGAYMQEISAQRAAGAQMDAAIREVAAAFDAFASDADDLANRRRVLQTSRPLAVFAYGLGDLRPETVKEIGTARCVARDGDISLVPNPATTAAIAAEAGQCERRAGEGSVDAECIAQATDAQPVSTSTESVAQRAERSSRAIQPFFEVGLGLGGDWLGTVFYSNGTDEDMNAGDGLSLGGGFVHRINSRFGVKYTATYNVWSATASNADILKSAFPIDIIPYYRTGDHKVGLGLSYHFSPKMDWDGFFPNDEFDDAAGITLEYGFRWFTFSYTDIDYEIGTESVDASRVSFKFSTTF